MSKRRISHAGARAKGHQFERDVGNRLKIIYPNIRRHLEYQDAEANGVDLINSGPYRIQCKRLRKYSSVTAINEVQCDEMLGDVPVLITKSDGGRALAVLPFEEFARLLELVHGA